MFRYICNSFNGYIRNFEFLKQEKKFEIVEKSTTLSDSNILKSTGSCPTAAPNHECLLFLKSDYS